VFIQNLRASTADCHKQLELNSLSLALMSDNVNEDIYCNYLNHLYSFVKGFEEFVYPILSNYFLNISKRKKAFFIEEDLKEYSFSTKEITLIQEQFFREIYTDIYTAAGAMYVLEGSTLGGQIIIKHLQKTLAPSFKGSAYFSAYHHTTGSMWKEFLQQLTALPTTDSEEQKIITGAIKTFEIINTILSNISPKITMYEH